VVRGQWFLQAVVMSCLILLVDGAARAKDMDFRLVPFGDEASCKDQKCIFVIAADGEITNSTPDQFKSFAKVHMKNPRVRAVVFLNSPGGGVMASMALGQSFRTLGVLAIIGRLERQEGGPPASSYVPAGRCYSACVYAFIGAKKRIVPPYSMIGIHRMFSFESDGEDGHGPMHKIYGNKEFVTKLKSYARQMGVSVAMVKLAEKTASTKIHIITPAELELWHIGSQNF
jgi:hypothetical protein